MTLQLAENLMALRFKTQKATKEDKAHEKKLLSLRESIEDSKQKLLSAQDNFNNVTEPKLIDFYIYKIQSEQSRYEQLLLEYRHEERSYICSSAE
ncbi:MAG: DUF2508 family protein [Clostridia bacterium]|nr:DUF2508 family protein [Clostridia bacterium]